MKIDKSLLWGGEKNPSTARLLRNMIRIIRSLDMNVVQEGVETREQKENLIALGDNYAQGYYFYRPMTKEQFREIIRDPANVTEGYLRKASSYAGQLRFRDMIREGLVSDTLLDNILRAAAIYREENGALTLVQLNGLYSKMTGISPNEEEMRRFTDRLAPGELEKLKELLSQANSHALGGSEGTVRFQKPDGSVVPLNMRVFLLYSLDSHHLYLSTMGS